MLIAHYWGLGWPYETIRVVLDSVHGIKISPRHLHRLIHSLGLKRNNATLNIDNVINFIANEVNGYGQCHGYHMMTLKCHQAGFRVSRHTVREILKNVDPAGVELRRRRRLIRRRYYGTGPNNNWHIDGYDKLKPYGLAINGCIDGFSRYVIWAEVSHTNNDPDVIAGYFMDAVLQRGGAPKIVRMDPGTENVNVEFLQQFLNEDEDGNLSNHHCVIIGSSHSNQRIEHWWGQLRKQYTEYLLMNFQQLQADGVFCGDDVDKDLVRFCFMDVVQVRY